ncbi:MAG: DUF1127 domain-containing protein [Rhodospirillaceae bacterium]|nr:DUF1127 domain-containing protein [Rhodospirillaceae bacterium]
MARFTDMEKAEVSRAKAATPLLEDSFGSAFGRLAASVRRRIAHGARRRAVAHELNALSERMLDDLGLTRVDVSAKAAEAAQHRFPLNGSIATDLVAFVRSGIVRPVQGWLMRRGAERHLRALDDRMLADIGIMRGDITAIVRSMQMSEAGIEADFDVVRPIRVWNRSRLAFKQLAAYDDRMLDDMGMVRGDIDWVTETLATRSVTANGNRAAHAA